VTDLSRELAQAARRDADEQSARLAEIPRSRVINVTVAATSPTVTVTWRGASVPISAKNVNYTPTVGDRVLCTMDDSDQLVIICRLG
jgi:hypothetical protein